VWISTLCWILYDAVFGSPAGIRHRSGEVLFVALFFVFGVWLIFRRHLITFDLKNGRVRIAAPGSISTERSVSGGLTLLLNQHRTEWCASVAYGPCEIARTAVLPSFDEARDRLLPFATALNDHLGVHTLREERTSKTWPKLALWSQARTARDGLSRD
jgi:hypothetical protein